VTPDRRALEEDFGMPDPESRRIATQQIPRLRGEDATSLLLRALGDGDWRVRKEAANIAPGVEPREEVVRALVGALAEKENIGLRNAAVEALVEIGADAVVPSARALAELDADGRKLAVEILGGIADPRGVDALTRALLDADPNVRATAAEALGNAKSSGEEAQQKAALALTRALSEDETLVRLAALDALVRLDAKVPWATFEPFMNDPVLRRRAIAAAGSSDEEAALLALAHAAGDASPGTAKEAIVALADHLVASPRSAEVLALARERVRASRRAVDTVRKLAADPEDARSKGSALVVLGLLGHKEDVPLLVLGLEDEEVAPRAEAALRLFGAPAVGPALEAARKSMPPVRAATLSLIPMLSDSPDSPEPFALDSLREALDDPNPEILVAALTALSTSGSEEDLGRVASYATSIDPRIAGTACSALKAMAPRHMQAARQLADAIDATGLRAVVGCVLIGAVAEGHAAGGSETVRPPDIAYLRTALDHGDVRVRRAALDALASIGDPGASDAVVFALADEEEDVVLAAVRALGRMRRAEPLLTLLRTTRNPGVVATTLLTLREASPDDAFEAARPLLSRSDPILACAAVEAIGKLAGPRRDEALRLALEHPVADVVTAAMVEIARGASEGALGKVGECLDHASPEVRRVAADLLGADGSPSAQASLRARLERETEPMVREAIAEALSARALSRGDGT
jgi:HEAT repeat protein